MHEEHRNACMIFLIFIENLLGHELIRVKPLNGGLFPQTLSECPIRLESHLVDAKGNQKRRKLIEELHMYMEIKYENKWTAVVWKYRASASTRASHQGRSRGSRVT
ncbi:MAG: hypothetical protein FD188_3345 [Ignavibacteria bacterium]|nr:MAG: hypothetical protein FD188_3345 [Ignavibacteria bacterium]